MTLFLILKKSLHYCFLEQADPFVHICCVNNVCGMWKYFCKNTIFHGCEFFHIPPSGFCLYWWTEKLLIWKFFLGFSTARSPISTLCIVDFSQVSVHYPLTFFLFASKYRRILCFDSDFLPFQEVIPRGGAVFYIQLKICTSDAKCNYVWNLKNYPHNMHEWNHEKNCSNSFWA